jgi:hypothetical protein
MLSDRLEEDGQQDLADQVRALPEGTKAVFVDGQLVTKPSRAAQGAESVARSLSKQARTLAQRVRSGAVRRSAAEASLRGKIVATARKNPNVLEGLRKIQREHGLAQQGGIRGLEELARIVSHSLIGRALEATPGQGAVSPPTGPDSNDLFSIMATLFGR